MLDFAMDSEIKKHRRQLVANAVANRAVGTTQYRALAKRFNYFLKQYDKFKEELSLYRAPCNDLDGDVFMQWSHNCSIVNNAMTGPDKPAFIGEKPHASVVIKNSRDVLVQGNHITNPDIYAGRIINAEHGDLAQR